MSEPQKYDFNEFVQSMNVLHRGWLSIFTLIEQAIDAGDLARAKGIITDSKKHLRKILKGDLS